MSRRLRDTAARYDRIVADYRRYWAPVLRVLCEPLLGRAPLRPDMRLLDIGCGPALLHEVVAHRVGSIVGVDLSFNMLRTARIPAVIGDGARIPCRDAAFDAAMSTFVLQHVPFPNRVYEEAGRVVRSGGLVLTATWAAGSAELEGPWEVVQRVLGEAGAPEVQGAKAWHERVDAPAKVTRYARRGGFDVLDAWTEEVVYRWQIDTFLGWVRAHRLIGERLEGLDEQRRRDVMAQVERELRGAPETQMDWPASVVSLIARRR